jgi:cyclopropane fatty-acyl-phospholipid synthase-like methyltransferase
VQVHAVDLRSLQDTHVLEIGGGAHDRFRYVAEHSVVGFDIHELQTEML